MLLNSIYPTFQGEVNAFGIGSPALFIRLQGCPIRCYKRTLGILCDTPEALKKPFAKSELNSIFAEVTKQSDQTKIKNICLTGGDPLWNDEKDIKELLQGLVDLDFNISIETSGTIDWTPYTSISSNIFWVIDYKLKSAGIKNGTYLFKNYNNIKNLRSSDYIKFVIYDLDDLDEAVKVIREFKNNTIATLSVGCFWGGKLSTFDIFNRFKDEKLLGDIVINMQTHKMAIASDYKKEIPTNV